MDHESSSIVNIFSPLVEYGNVYLIFMYICLYVINPLLNGLKYALIICIQECANLCIHLIVCVCPILCLSLSVTDNADTGLCQV